jgi:hypothetical protein
MRWGMIKGLDKFKLLLSVVFIFVIFMIFTSCRTPAFITTAEVLKDEQFESEIGVEYLHIMDYTNNPYFKHDSIPDFELSLRRGFFSWVELGLNFSLQLHLGLDSKFQFFHTEDNFLAFDLYTDFQLFNHDYGFSTLYTHKLSDNLALTTSLGIMMSNGYNGSDVTDGEEGAGYINYPKKADFITCSVYINNLLGKNAENKILTISYGIIYMKEITQWHNDIIIPSIRLSNK